MTKQELITLAMSGYPGGDDTAGDTLALFIQRELADTYEPGRPEAIQLSIAAHALQRGVEDLQAALEPVYKRLTTRTALRLAA